MMMRTPASSSSVESLVPALVVMLVIILGFTVYLRRARYIRRRSAYITIGILVVAITLLGAFMYFFPLKY